MNKSRVVSTAAMVFFGFMILVFLSSGAFITIQPGYNGVLFRKFGGGLDTENIFGQGFHVIAPWNTMHIYDVRIKEKFEQMDVLSSDGLSIHVDMSIRYRILADKIGLLHEQVGGSFESTIIAPEIRSSTRKAIGQYIPEELYSSKRDAIQTEIFSLMSERLAEKYIILDAILIREVNLPAKIKEAIERKLEQEQEAQQYTFRIEKEKKEAERKRIEAQGVKDFQDIVSQGISDKLLRWKGIEATQDLAKSSNSKIVIIGGKDGLPVILNQD